MDLSQNETDIVITALNDYSASEYLKGNNNKMVDAQNLIKRIEEASGRGDSGQSADAGSETGIELENGYNDTNRVCEVCDE